MGKKALILFLVAIFCLGLGFAAGMVVQNGGFGGILAFVSGNQEEETVNFVHKVVTVGDNTANVYEKADATSDVIYAMSDGETATCVKQGKEWLKLEIADGVYGYAHASLFTLATNYAAADDTETAKDQDKDTENTTTTTYVTPTVKVLDLYAGASSDYKIVTTVEHGAILELKEKDDTWSKVATLDGEEGYVLTTEIETTDYDPDAVVIKVTNSYVNIRAEASSDSEKLGTLDAGETAAYLGEEDNFYKIKTEDGTEGYVSMDYTEKVQGN